MIDKSRRFCIFTTIFFALFFGLFLSLVLGVRAFASSTDQETVSYHFYSSGFHFLTGRLSFTQTDRNYDVNFSGEPRGFLGRLLPWSADMSSKGAIASNDLVPKKFRNSTSWRGKEKIANLTYDEKGVLIEYSRTSNDVTKQREIKDIYRTNSTDLLTSIASVLKAASAYEGNNIGKACEKEYPVFDGKRRYDIVLSNPITETLKKNRYSIFSGEAVKCTLVVKEIDGFKAKKKSGWGNVSEGKRDETGQKPMIWLARLSNDSAVKIVRIQLKTDFGTVIAHLGAGT